MPSPIESLFFEQMTVLCYKFASSSSSIRFCIHCFQKQPSYASNYNNNTHSHISFLVDAPHCFTQWGDCISFLLVLLLHPLGRKFFPM